AGVAARAVDRVVSAPAVARAAAPHPGVGYVRDAARLLRLGIDRGRGPDPLPADARALRRARLLLLPPRRGRRARLVRRARLRPLQPRGVVLLPGADARPAHAGGEKPRAHRAGLRAAFLVPRGAGRARPRLRLDLPDFLHRARPDPLARPLGG